MSDERRNSTRHQVEVRSMIELKTPVPCTLADVSNTGARVQVRDPSKLPEQFILNMNHEVRRWCRVQWRTQDEVGVVFIDPPKPG
jgi:hypothetical protein